MNKISLFVVMTLGIGILAGCSRGAIGGAAGGILGAGAGYEYNAKRQMDQLDADLKAGKVNQQEYDIRKSQIQRDSLIQ